jgi:DNA-binding transcriptional LysR family regulator
LSESWAEDFVCCMTVVAGKVWNNSLHIAQPALSRQIKKLEAALGISLFDRTPRRLHLTIEGRELAGRLPALFSQIDHLAVKGASIGGTAQFRIGDGTS